MLQHLQEYAASGKKIHFNLALPLRNAAAAKSMLKKIYCVLLPICIASLLISLFDAHELFCIAVKCAFLVKKNSQKVYGSFLTSCSIRASYAKQTVSYSQTDRDSFYFMQIESSVGCLIAGHQDPPHPPQQDLHLKKSLH